MKLEEIRKLCEAKELCRSQWQVKDGNIYTLPNPTKVESVVDGSDQETGDQWASDDTLNFIAASRDLMPKLLDVAEAYRNVREKFLPNLLHGDDEHQAWLTQRVNELFQDSDMALKALEGG